MTNASQARSKVLATGHLSVSVEVLAYILVISLSLVFRVMALGDTPLNNQESRAALSALQALSSTPQTSGFVDSILIFGGTVLSFAVATPTNTAARIVSSVVGVLLTLSPLMFRRQLGPVPTFIAVTLLSISPTAIVTSREMTGTGISIIGYLATVRLAEDFLLSRRPTLVSAAGVSIAIALLADFAALLIGLALGMGVLFARLTDEEGEMSPDILQELWDSVPRKHFVISFAVSLVAFGTLFFLTPSGLGTIGNHLSRFFAGTVTRQVGTPHLGIVLISYEPVLIVFGLIGAWIASQSPRPWRRILAGWGVAAVLLSVLYQGLLPVHGLWVVVPLAGLAAVAVNQLARLEHDAPSWAILVYVAAIIGCLAMIYLRVAHQLRAPALFPIGAGPGPDQPGLNVPIDLVWVTIGIVLLALLWLAVASFWEPAAAWQGLGIGLALPGMLMMVGQSGELAFAHPLSPYELFHTAAPQQGVVHLVRTAGEISEFATGNPREAEITIQGDPQGVLAWSVSDFNYITYVDAPSPDVHSVMVITPADGSSPFLGSNYVGQDFVIESQWDSTQLDPSEAVGWLLFRTAAMPPLTTQRVILWVREDVYRLVPQRAAP